MVPKGSQKIAKGNQKGAKGSQKGAKGSKTGPNGSQKGTRSEAMGDQNASKSRSSEKVAKKVATGGVAMLSRGSLLATFFHQKWDKKAM